MQTMAVPQTDTARLRRVARMLKTLSHPVRLAITDLLIREDKLKVTEVSNKMLISQSNASQHLRALEDAGILLSERDGKCIFYGVKDEKVRRILSLIDACEAC
jgi:ArsR family transcriptional regulator